MDRKLSTLSPCLYACKLVTLKKHLFPHLTHYHSNVSTKKDHFFGCTWPLRSAVTVLYDVPCPRLFFFFTQNKSWW